ncbi:MAG: type II secretion system protein [Gemmatimonadota bacterium]
MTTARRTARSGFTMIEALMVITVLGIVYLMVIPRISEIKSTSSLRAARQELTSAFAAARAAALQKGKNSTLTLTSGTATVSVFSGLNSTNITVLGPIGFGKELGTSLAAVGGSPLTVSFDARGLVTPVPAGVYKYRLVNGAKSDTVCISAAGVILSKTCQL